MFFDDGWAPLSDVTSEVFRRLQKFKSEGLISEAQGGLGATLAISVWDICDAATKVGVTAPDGTVIPASKDLVAWADPRDLSNEHLNMKVGTVGSSTLSADGEPATPEMMQARYGPFYSLPVVLPVNNFQSSLTFLEEEVKNQSFKDELVVGAAKLILKLAADGPLVTREIAQDKLGANVSRRKFKLAWALASQQIPEFVKPNRWVGL